MVSKSYERAQRMVLSDKYNAVSESFQADVAQLVKRYFEADVIKVDTYCDGTLQVVFTVSVKRVKLIKRA